MTVNNLDEKMELLTTAQLAQRLNIAISTLKRWRAANKGPKFIFVEGCLRYRNVDVEKYLESREAMCA